MTTYIIVLSLIWLLAFAEYILKKKSAFYIAIIIAYFFAAFRFQTGHDWLLYRNVFENTPPIFSSSFKDLFLTSQVYGKEFLFILYNSLLKQFWGEFQIIIIVTTSIYFYSFIKFISIINAPRTIVLAASYSWLIFSLYFSTLSQSLAISFFLLFWVSRINQQNRLSIIWALFSILFQVSALMYFVLYFLANKTPKKNVLLFAWILLIVIIISKIDLGGALVELILSATSSIGLSGISNKLHYYLFERGLILNNFDLIFVILFTIAIGGWFLFRKKTKNHIEQADLFGFSIFFILFQGLFINHVVFRYRLLYVAFPIVFIVIFSTYKNSKASIRVGIILISFLMSMIYGILYLNKQSSIAFIPYQNYIYKRLFGDLNKSTGEDRIRESINNTSRQN